MTPIYLYLPLAIIAFAFIDRRRGRRPLWFANTVVALALYGICYLIHL